MELRYGGLAGALRGVVRSEGAPALWRGFGPAAARAVAMNTAMLASFDELRVPGRGKEKNGGWVDGLGEVGGDHL